MLFLISYNNYSQYIINFEFHFLKEGFVHYIIPKLLYIINITYTSVAMEKYNTSPNSDELIILENADLEDVEYTAEPDGDWEKGCKRRIT